LIFALAGAVLFFWVPFLIVRIRTRRRMKAFNHQLGDALILISNSLRTGYSFIQSFDLVAREMQPPMSEEFSRTMKEMNLGMTTEDALEKMTKRVPSNDLDLVITAVLIQRQVGGNLAELLDNLAHTIRERVTIRGHIKTLTAQGRISGIIISLLPLGIGAIIYFFNPEYIRILFTHSVGSKLLIGAFVSQIVGIFLVRRIVNIKV
jgi:tight adherence protein B